MVVLLLVQVGCAPTGVQGQVVNQLTGEPVIGAKVTITGTALTVTTDDTGSYRIEEVAPGPQGIEVKADGLVCVNEVSLTVAKGQVIAAASVDMFPHPGGVGLFLLDGSELTAIPAWDSARLDQSKWALRPHIMASKIGEVIQTGGEIDAILYTDQASPAAVSMKIVKLSLEGAHPQSTWQFPSFWQAAKSGADVQQSVVTDGVTRLQIELTEGHYFLVRKHRGADDWTYPFTVSTASGS